MAPAVVVVMVVVGLGFAIVGPVDSAVDSGFDVGLLVLSQEYYSPSCWVSSAGSSVSQSWVWRFGKRRVPVYGCSRGDVLAHL